MSHGPAEPVSRSHSAFRYAGPLAAGLLAIALTGCADRPSDARAPAGNTATGTTVDVGLLAVVEYQTPLRPAGMARTDAGRAIRLGEPRAPRPASELAAAELRALAALRATDALAREGPATEGYNCHGWVFAAGRYWVRSADVAVILEDNGYAPVNDPRPGDLAVYRMRSEIVHSALVRAVAGGRVEVEGKWGWMGRVRHAVGESVFGTEYRFYRSARSGHALAGLRSEEPDGVGDDSEPESEVGDEAAR